MGRDQNNTEHIQTFFEMNKVEMQNPIIKRFLYSQENYDLLLRTIENPSLENMKKIDYQFKKHYIKVKRIKYVNNLIYFYSRDYENRRKRISERNLLVLDDRLSSDGETTLIEQIPSDREHLPFKRNFIDHIENPDLEAAILNLTGKQIHILEMIYFKNLTLKEISKILETSPQNVSNQHRKALRKLNKLVASTME